MNASEQIDGLIARLTDWRGTTLANLRRIICEADPEIEGEKVDERSLIVLVRAGVDFNKAKAKPAAKKKTAK